MGTPRSSEVALSIARRFLDIENFEVDANDLPGLTVWRWRSALAVIATSVATRFT